MLTTHEIAATWELHTKTYFSPGSMAEDFARAIESAACADRDARIAELEQRNRDLYEDVQRFKEHALSEKDARMALERELAEVRKQMEAQKDEWLSWDAKRSALEKDAKRWLTFLSTRPQATHEVINQAIDDAAMKKE